MNQHERLDSQLPERLTDLGGSSSDDTNDILERTARTRQRPAWTFPGRWFPMLFHSPGRPLASPMPSRAVWLLLIIGLLAAALAAGGAFIVGSRGLSGPGPNGLSAATAAMPPTACPAGVPLRGGDIATIAGGGTGTTSGDSGQAIATTLKSPGTVAVDAAGAVYYADATDAAVKRIGLDGLVSVMAGPSTGAPFVEPSGLAFDAVGDLHVADFKASRIWKVDANGVVIVAAGTGESGSTGNDGPAVDAKINAAQVAVGPDGSLYFDDMNMYRMIDPEGIIHAFAGTGAKGFSGDGLRATDATMDTAIAAVGADHAGNVYIGDSWNHRVRRIDPSGIITTVAGNGHQGTSGDGRSATDAQMSQALGIATDDAGNVYFSDYDSSSVRKIDANGIITTVAGGKGPGFHGDCGPAIDAKLSAPNGLAVHDGVLYIADSGNNRIRMVVP